MESSFLGGRVVVKTGDITLEDADAIVNAANRTLLGGGGVDGAIHRRGGRRIYEECEALRRTSLPDGLPTGEAVITTGGDLAARFVIHTVGPIFGRHGGVEARLLAACYENSLALAAARGLATVAFPSISTGAYGFPRHAAAVAATDGIVRGLAAADMITQVRLVFFSDGDAATFLEHQKFG